RARQLRVWMLHAEGLPFGHGSVDWFQVRDDLRAMRLEERRQHDLLAERGLVFVHGETRTVRCDLEQDPVWLAEVQTAKPVPVHFAAVADTERVEPIGPCV